MRKMLFRCQQRRKAASFSILMSASATAAAAQVDHSRPEPAGTDLVVQPITTPDVKPAQQPPRDTQSYESANVRFRLARGPGIKASVVSRGVTMRYQLLDGHPVSSSIEMAKTEIARSEVAGGGEAVLNGTLGPGGVLDVRTLQPQPRRFSSIRAALDEQGKRSLMLDNVGVLSPALQYRVSAAGEDSEKRRRSSAGNEISLQQQNYAISSSFKYLPDDDNRYLLRLTVIDQGQPEQSSAQAPSAGAGLSLPSDEFKSLEQRVQFGWDRTLRNGWRNSLLIGYYDKALDDYQAPLLPGAGGSAPAGPPAGPPVRPRSVGPSFSTQDVDERGRFVSDRLSRDYQFAGFNHALLLGVSHFDRDVSPEDGRYQSDEFALLMQNQTRLSSRWAVLAGVRQDWLESTDERGTHQQDDISAQLGVRYGLSRDTSIYVSYTEALLPNYREIPVGVLTREPLLSPEQRRQYELGISSRLLAGRMELDAAVYQLIRDNVRTFRGQRARLNAREQSRGLDLQATLRPMPGWRLRARYNYIDSEIVNDGDRQLATEGHRPFNLPQHRADVWGSYEFLHGRLKGLGAGIGTEVVSSRFTDNQNTETVSGYAVFNTALWYQFRIGPGKQGRVQAGIRNLTDKSYIKPESNDKPFRQKLGEGRTLYLTAQLIF